MKIKMVIDFENKIAKGFIMIDGVIVCDINVTQDPEALRHMRFLAKSMSLIDGDLD